MEPYWQSDDGRHTVYCGDALQVLRQLSMQQVQCCITSPPYWGLRDYGHPAQLGLESTLEEYVTNLLVVFQEVRRILKDNGTVWCNIGDNYASGKTLSPGLKPKDLCGTPWRVAFALQADGWWLRSEIIWHKSNPMPESVTDRPTRAHEQVFLFAKNPKYYYDADAIREPQSVASIARFGARSTQRINPRSSAKERNDYRCTTGENFLGCHPAGRNCHTVWPITLKPFPGAHFATFPPLLVQPCLLAGSPQDSLVLDPFGGAGTVALVAVEQGRQSLSIELNPAYCALAVERLKTALTQQSLPLAPTTISTPTSRQERLL